MLERTPDDTENAPKVTDDEVIEIIRQRLPHWQAACDHAGADIVILQQQAFGKTHEEIFLMGLAIRYAGIAGKNVMIAT
jgi:hypothetical protein